MGWGDERNYSVTHRCSGFSWGEQVLEYLHDALAQLGAEAFKNQMWV
jgi:hypothetical protein